MGTISIDQLKHTKTRLITKKPTHSKITIDNSYIVIQDRCLSFSKFSFSSQKYESLRRVSCKLYTFSCKKIYFVMKDPCELHLVVIKNPTKKKKKKKKKKYSGYTTA